MLLIGLLFALFTVGFVVPCLVDVARTPRVRGPQPYQKSLADRDHLALRNRRPGVAGGRRPTGRWQAPLMYRPLTGSRGRRQQEAFRRHPAGRDQELDIGTAADRGAFPASARPVGPDDDPEFLLELARRIRGEREADNDA